MPEVLRGIQLDMGIDHAGEDVAPTGVDLLGPGPTARRIALEHRDDRAVLGHKAAVDHPSVRVHEATVSEDECASQERNRIRYTRAVKPLELPQMVSIALFWQPA